MTVLQALRKTNRLGHVCEEARQWARRRPLSKKTWEECPRGDWLELFCIWCADISAPTMPEVCGGRWVTPEGADAYRKAVPWGRVREGLKRKGLL